MNVISKSGTTTEPAIAFRVFRGLLEKKYGKDGAKEPHLCHNGQGARHAERTCRRAEGYETFVVPDDVGGRYSVLTAVGLLPIAAAGCDIDRADGGRSQSTRGAGRLRATKNDCYRYAAARNILYRKGKSCGTAGLL